MWWLQIFTNFGIWNLPLLKFFCRLFNKPLIEVHYDCGFGHKLFIRGELPELSWTKGQELTNIGPNLWVWSSNVCCTGLFKILLDDQVYEEGSNHQLLDPSGAIIRPTFNASSLD